MPETTSDKAIITRRSLHGELVPLLRDMILGDELQPGDKIPEQALCARFGVSRTPLREALKVLAAEGLLVLTPNRGAMVARISNEEIDAYFPIMGALEALAGEIACTRITTAQFAKLKAMHDAMVAHYQAGEVAPYLNLNKAIHAAFFEIAGNAPLTQLYNNLMVRIHAVRFVAKKSPARWREAVDDHERMMEALAERDGPRLGRILRDHLRHKAGMVLESLAGLDAKEKPEPRTAGKRAAAKAGDGAAGPDPDGREPPPQPARGKAASRVPRTKAGTVPAS
ncbi:MAG: GntR family transcriptional regulator [Rhizobiales bacterium 24-66-13]|jgi:DNA-binding GntR family transcriptional regulator|uniref:GntR family transcriptional regulator n=1 Tax=Roseixanthobacter finlandensis TaxID=3119922 RepID=UPI000BD12B02|nr:MAG: GntR family transcriptional regulator [Rhizobiales bacterium 35-66-30]OYZ71738.1 MAG: GntR family transcriptional regulator [Rhizobiales bacterium 24-66-13]OZB04797.1 MAG: GntR family transcriptional regulator [Rhizobiales bacterium 39-66-18]HQS07765.1 GntR family transcriptional regulator [Xanthobacteraceae bacterium]HQS45246.1 GntR family transcriptional regulator [Xanthobacteraceae bacterium]